MKNWTRMNNLDFKKCFLAFAVFAIFVFALMQIFYTNDQTTIKDKYQLESESVNNIFDDEPNGPKAVEITTKKIAELKYIVYECKDICGGWADRLKGIHN